MSFAWDRMQSEITRVFAETTGIPFTWDDTIKRIPRAPIGVLSLGQSETVGRDYSRHTFRNSDITLDVYGYRELTVNIQIRARLSKTAPSSRVLCEKARLALADPVYRDELRAAGLVFVETHPLINLDFSRTARKELRSAFDIVFRLALHDQLPSRKTDYFESVSVSESLI